MIRLCVTLLLFLASLDILSAEDGSAVFKPVMLRTLDLQDCSVMRIFARVWKYTPLVERERAAWIILNSKGQYEQIDWLKTPERNITIWSEALPKNIVAQVHTHGDHLDPKPSNQDMLISRKLNIWVYTLTRKGIWRVAPDGSITQQLDAAGIREQ